MFFLHIPRTAGTTFRLVLESYFDALEICFAYDLQGVLERAAAGDLTRCRLIRGHLFYAAGQLLPQPPLYVTFLRDPVARVISLYHFIRRSASHPRHEYARDMVIGDFAEFYAASGPVTNAAVHFIGTAFDVTDAGSYREIITKEHHQDNFELAKQRLSDFAFVGLTERFQDSLFMFFYTMRWRPAARYQPVNIAPGKTRRDDYAPADIDKLAALNALDGRLYDFAQVQFEARFTQMTHELLERYGERSHAHLKPPLSDEVMLELLRKHARPIRSFSPGDRVRHTVRYYRVFPLLIEPYLPSEAAREALYTGPGGLYGWGRRQLKRIGLLGAARRLFGRRFIMTIRYLFSARATQL